MLVEKNVPKLALSKPIKKSEHYKKQSEFCSTKSYSKFMFQGVIYHVGEHLLFRETNKTAIIGQVMSILPQVQHKNQAWPMLKVKWYYRKQDIIQMA
jgi:hypothetical protein